MLRILQLDTRFPRPAGDVACPDTYIHPPQIEKIEKARVGDIISPHADKFDVSAFRQAVESATEPLTITSCGFMIKWQKPLSFFSSQFISSSLVCLSELRKRYSDSQILIMTFDDVALQSNFYKPHLEGFAGHILGINKQSHLYQVIKNDLDELDISMAEQQLLEQLSVLLRENNIAAILLECTNLSVYKQSIKKIFSGEIIDLLCLVERAQTGVVKPQFL